MLAAIRRTLPVAARSSFVRAMTQLPYLPHTPAERKEMLDVIGAKDVDEFFNVIPEAARLKKPLDLPPPKSEIEVMREMTRMADKNMPASKSAFFLGAGFYRHHLPTVVDHLIQRSEILTAYTPYQPEVSQGTLQVLFEFQTQVSMLTGMDLANASMYDGPTACSEAVLMARRIKNKRPKVVLSGGLHPHYSGVVNTLMEDLKPLADAVHKKGALLVATFSEVFSLGALKSPGAMGADIVIGEGQSLGSPMSFGGPSVGLMATKQEYMRQIPGRLIGQTVDAEGRRAWCLAIGTREQHIRREKATSNICTSSGVCATAFSMHLACLGEAGFTSYAKMNHANASILAERIKKEVPSAKVLNKTFFNEFAVELKMDAEKKLLAQGVMGGVPCSRLFGTKENGLGNVMLVACTELTTKDDMDKLIAGLKKL